MHTCVLGDAGFIPSTIVQVLGSICRLVQGGFRVEFEVDISQVLGFL